MTAQRLTAWLLAAACVIPPGCLSLETFRCTDGADCRLDGASGTCESNGLCSFAASSCASGRRYGRLGGELANSCVEPEIDSGCGDGLGARPPTQGAVTHIGPGDDLVAAMAVMQAGDTLHVAAGMYELAATLALRPGVFLQGEPGAVLRVTGGFNVLDATLATNTTVECLTLDGGADWEPTGDTECGGLRGDRAHGLKLLNNRFDHFHGGGGFCLFSSNDVTVSHNQTADIDQFASVASFANNHGVSIVDNRISGVHRYGIELQGDANDLHIDGNVMSDLDQLAILVRTGSGTGATVNGNTVSRATSGLDVSGNGLTVEGNTFRDVLFDAVGIGCAPAAAIHDNVFSNVGVVFNDATGYCGGEVIGVNTIDGAQVTGRP